MVVWIRGEVESRSEVAQRIALHVTLIGALLQELAYHRLSAGV